ncbi:MAG: carotenoid biosynthesis protein [Anaerolineaceae bacterium]
MTLQRIIFILLVLFALANVYSLFGQPLGIVPATIIPLTGFAFAFFHAVQREGREGALRLLALVFGVSLLFESVGVATGWIYGPYHYTDKLGPMFLGLVPYLIPITWFMMSYLSFVIAEWLVPSGVNFPGAERRGRILAVAAVGGLVMTSWDLIMDPIMVAGGNWVWETDGAYFGIPLQNFVGWWLTFFTGYALYLLVRGKAGKAPEAGFDRLALLGYLATALMSVTGMLIDGAGNLALIGFFAMMPWAIMGWMKLSAK